jgi:hypothetical protein
MLGTELVRTVRRGVFVCRRQKDFGDRSELRLLRLFGNETRSARRERCKQLLERSVGCCPKRPAPPDGDAAARFARRVEELAQKPRLADPRVAANEHDAAVNLCQGAAAIDEERQFARAADELRTNDQCRDQTIGTPLTPSACFARGRSMPSRSAISPASSRESPGVIPDSYAASR